MKYIWLFNFHLHSENLAHERVREMHKNTGWVRYFEQAKKLNAIVEVFRNAPATSLGCVRRLGCLGSLNGLGFQLITTSLPKFHTVTAVRVTPWFTRSILGTVNYTCEVTLLSPEELNKSTTTHLVCFSTKSYQIS